jgi:Nif-specific regulatory protein
MENNEKHPLIRGNERLQASLKEKYRPANIIGNSKPMRMVYSMIEKIAPARTTVLIIGKTGVGKELIANAIHYSSSFASGPFVKFNVAALPETLIESELFGHEKGAFTGAIDQRKGRFEEAENGTLFIDEIGELPINMQTKLLRVLQEHSFERVGGNRPINVNIRIIAATNRDLAVMVREGTFREDLFYRLNVFPLVIPPLSKRGDDIIELANHFAQHYGKRNDKGKISISPPAQKLLLEYSWPGNVRELENVMERAVILCEDSIIHVYNLPQTIQTYGRSEGITGTGLCHKLDQIEYEMIVEALTLHRGNISLTAKALELSRRMLGIRMKKFRLNFRDFKACNTRQ